jgi:hypothetical protein
MAMKQGLSRGEAAIVKACYFQPRYSGATAHKFWNEVRHPANDRALYDFACALQDLEARVLAVLNDGVRIRAQKIILADRMRNTRAK